MLLSDMTSSTAPRGDMMTDVFIAGSGPIGATFAKKFVEAGHNVVMVEIGAADSVVSRPPPQQAKSTEHDNRGFVPNVNWSVVPGYHKKNEIEYQKDIDRFVNVIKGALSTVSVPTSNVAIPTLDPLSFQNTKEKPFISLGKNPAQNPFENLGAEAVTRGVGGMTTHWTCATPEFHPVLERPKLDENPTTNDEIWAKLYKEAKGLIGTSTHEFDQSIRHTLVLDTYKKLHEKTDRRAFEPLPLACHRLDDPDYVEWHAADRILETLFTDPEKKKKFTLLTNHRCIRVRPTHYNAGQTNNIGYAEIENLMPHMTGQKDNAKFKIRAKVYVIACGAVATAQILANSNVPEDAQPGDGGNRDTSDDIIETPLMPNLGHYITEQPMAFCQVVLNGDLIKSVGEDLEHKPTWWSEKVKKHLARHPNDPIPIPFRDPEPQVTTRVSDIHPWHTQIHRDAFSYGAVAENIDTRLIVDFRFFGMVEPREQNRIVFQKHYRDAYNMPQPTFRFQMSKNDSERARTMMDDMCKLALEVGGFLPGSEPQFMTPGLALHLGGTTRTGLEKDKNKTVADTNSQVWNFTNLFVGGNNVIPTAFAANPTLTSICYAIRSADHINANWSSFK